MITSLPRIHQLLNRLSVIARLSQSLKVTLALLAALECATAHAIVYTEDFEDGAASGWTYGGHGYNLANTTAGPTTAPSSYFGTLYQPTGGVGGGAYMLGYRGGSSGPAPVGVVAPASNLTGFPAATYGTHFSVSYYGRIFPSLSAPFALDTEDEDADPDSYSLEITGPTGNPNIGSNGLYKLPTTTNGVITHPSALTAASTANDSSGKNQVALRHTFSSPDPDGVDAAGVGQKFGSWTYRIELGNATGENRVAFETDWTLIDMEIDTTWTDEEAKAHGWTQDPTFFNTSNQRTRDQISWNELWNVRGINVSETLTGARGSATTTTANGTAPTGGANGPPGLYYHVFGIDEVTVQTFVAEDDADFDADGDVDGADFLTWQRGVGVGTTLGEGNADGDEDVDGADLAIWESQFGQPAAQANANPVPEPGSCALLALGALALAWRRRAGGRS